MGIILELRKIKYPVRKIKFLNLIELTISDPIFKDLRESGTLESRDAAIISGINILTVITSFTLLFFRIFSIFRRAFMSSVRKEILLLTKSLNGNVDEIE